MINCSRVERTVYMEKYPINSDHESLRHLLEKYGKVVHVSLPRYPTSREFKGFAFVEFATPQAAAECVQDPESPLYVITKRQWSALRDNYLPYTKSLIVRLSKVPAQVSKQELKSLLEPIAPVGFIETDRQTRDGLVDVRYLSTTHTQMVVDQFKTFDCEILSGEQELQVWKRISKIHKRKLEAEDMPSSNKRARI